MIVLRQVEHSHTPIVSTYIIKRLHHFQRIAYCLRLLQSLAVQSQGIVKLTVVTHYLTHFFVSDDATEHIALALHTLLQHRERIKIS